jgi:glutathione-specific gamma-glutamylcyclotransferase
MSTSLTPQSLAELNRIWRIRPRGNLWLFAYASLIWRPEGKVLESRPGKIFGWHRSLCMKSTLNRGTPDNPGLVFALDHGGACKGLALRVGGTDAYEEFTQLWMREMVNAIYTPHWVNCHTPEGMVVALTFTLGRTHPSYLSRLSDEEYLRRFKQCTGRYGTTWDYVKQTHDALHEIGITDAPLCRLVNLARAAGM